MDNVHSYWNLLFVITLLGHNSITKQIHETSIKKWMDSRPFRIIHQWVSVILSQHVCVRASETN